ncbi:Glycosyltransferase involved in cell wall bisynthesis [Treponema berlinense]|uniref:Glycosyltransferase involved in cell wall bisynthesis n=1 Tax=Treponema berlinense TaxID=225004 RepID=A0A1T4MHC5_9SPIR|nr:DUF1972 domain-containing protein [Treponema berlinense]SJZ66419.1 Glycosyltransferase involved in cell wall bisynthesis [Treponema berlinense]
MKKVSIIGTVGVPACYGGFESLVENILDYTPSDIEYIVFCTSKKYETKLESYKGAKLKYLDLNANGKDSIMYDYKSMKMSLDADIMLILGVSGCMFLPFIKRKFKGKIITNIDGLEWKRDKWNFLAKWLLHYSEKMAVKYSDIVIGDNKGITDYVKEAYKKDAVLIAYGGDHVSKINDDSLYKIYPFCKNPYSVTVCRIEPENNIHIILEAFSKMPENQLVMVGNWKNGEYGSEMKDKYSKFENIHLLDPIYESHTINWIRSNASVYIHGHSAGGTNPSLVEAMNFGLPILAFDCVYNKSTTQNECLYWKKSEDIILLMNDKSNYEKIATKMKEIGSKEYSWKKIAEQYNSLY